jgi:two-component system sensor histidine kinase YesM
MKRLFKLQPKNSIFSRLVITFLVIISPIYALGIYIYYWGMNTVKSEISKSTTEQVSSYIEGLEKDITRIKILQYDCLNDEHLNKLAVRWEIMEDYEKVDSMLQLQQRLVTIKNSSNYIKNVSVHIPSINKSISSNTMVDDLNLDKFNRIRVPQGQTGAQIIYLDKAIYLSTIQQKSPFSYTSLYLLEVELSQDAFSRELSKLNTYEGGGVFLVSLRHNVIFQPLDNSIELPMLNILRVMGKVTTNEMEHVNIGSQGYYIAVANSEYLDMALMKYIPERIITEPIQNFYIWVWIFSFTAFCIIFIYSFSTYKFMHKPLQQLVESFHKVEVGDLNVSINHDSDDEFGYLYKRFNEMVKNLNMLIDQVYNQKIMTQRAELKQLQSQINPHFLYNSFFMINTMARIGDENLAPFTKKLGEYFRFVTRNSSDYISLEDEVEHARVYIGIQQIRFGKRLTVRFDECPETVKKLSVPRLIIQPILENAFEYGIERKKDKGFISVKFDVVDDLLMIIVEDNGSNMPDKVLSDLQNCLEHNDKAEITAINNIHNRVKIVFGGSSGLEFFRSEYGGLKAILKIRIPGGGDLV